MIRIFEKIKEAYRRYRRRDIRNKFREALKYGNYPYALDLLEDYYKKINLSSGDLGRLKEGFDTYQNRLENLERMHQNRLKKLETLEIITEEQLIK